jgi:hypothetical protein
MSGKWICIERPTCGRTEPLGVQTPVRELT